MLKMVLPDIIVSRLESDYSNVERIEVNRKELEDRDTTLLLVQTLRIYSDDPALISQHLCAIANLCVTSTTLLD